jgi:hypothetical protein
LARFATEHLPSVKPSTQQRHRISLDNLAAQFGTVHLDEITKAHLADLADEDLLATRRAARR